VELADVLLAIEFMDRKALALVEQKMGYKDPFNEAHAFYVLVEVSSSSEQRLVAFMEQLEGKFDDGIVPQSAQQVQEVWKLRETVAESFIKYGQTYKYDLSLDKSAFYRIVEEVQTRIVQSPVLTTEEKSVIKVSGYGHIGDGNLHLNVGMPGYQNKQLHHKVHEILEPFVFDFVRTHKGSVSAEHGVGLQKKDYLSYSKSDELIEYMKLIK